MEKRLPPATNKKAEQAKETHIRRLEGALFWQDCTQDHKHRLPATPRRQTIEAVVCVQELFPGLLSHQESHKCKSNKTGERTVHWIYVFAHKMLRQVGN